MGLIFDHGDINSVQMNICGQSEDFPSVTTAKENENKGLESLKTANAASGEV